MSAPDEEPIGVGDCFYYSTPPNEEHLFVVLAPSIKDNGFFVCANISTKREFSDCTCELEAGEYVELTSPVSVVVYAEARELPPKLIRRLKRRSKLPQMDRALLVRIQEAALVPRSRMKQGFQASIRAHLQGASEFPA